jgi:ABC-type multidrug transport system fused ATPase/permease subunit
MLAPQLRRYNLLTSYLRPLRLKVALLTLLLLGGIGLQLVNPQILRRFIDTAMGAATNAGALRELLLLAGLFIGVTLITQMVTVGATYLSEQVGWTATNMLRGHLARHCLRLDMAFHNLRTPGELIERIDGDVTALSTFFSKFVIQVFGSGLLLIGVLIMLFLEDARVGAALTIFALIALLTLARSRNMAVASMREDREARARLTSFIEERLAGLDDVRANGGGSYVMQRLFERMRQLTIKGRGAAMMSARIWIITTGLFVLGYALALSIGAYLFNAGLISLGTVYLFFQYTALLRRPLEQIADQLKEFQQASASISRVQELLTLQPTIVDGADEPLAPAELHAGALEVAFEQVTFGYDDDQPVLNQLSFRLEPGVVLGLLGRTGSGKTTLTRLLFRLYDPRSGVIRLGGRDIRGELLADLRAQIGIVTQDVQLFHATVRDNLTLFDPRVPDERIRQALLDLGLGEWYAALPHGLDTVLAPGGGLSAGEAQLLAFARVFLKDPALVILDEASSRLDPATERLIERAIDKLLRPEAGHRRTCIIIAHRLATVQRADRIMILERGRMLEYGERAALAADPQSRFAQLLRVGLEEVLV